METWSTRLAVIRELFIVKIIKFLIFKLFFNVLTFFCLTSIILLSFINLLVFFDFFLLIFFKLFLLIFFFFFNIVSFFFFVDSKEFFFVAINLFFSFSKTNTFFYFLEIIFVFLYDCYCFLIQNFLNFFNLKNFFGIFTYVTEMLGFLSYEMVDQFFEQSNTIDLISYIHWSPRFLFGDSLGRNIRLKNFLNIFDFSNLMREKSFVYRRVGLISSRFWLFTAYKCDDEIDNLVKQDIGKFIEPDRWLLDFRNFRIFDYIDPWHFFFSTTVYRTANFDEFIEVELLHNYHSVMESYRELPYERIYSDEFAGTSFLIECFFFSLIYIWLFFMVEKHSQNNYFGLIGEEEEDDLDLNSHPYYEKWNANENFESNLFSSFSLDRLEYTSDDDLSWDSILAQPEAMRFSQHNDLYDFETKRKQNFLLDEFRMFSVLYPMYRLLFNLSIYKPVDFFLFTDSGKCFKILFSILLYIPIAIIILFFKLNIKFIDWVYSFPIIIKWLLSLLIFAVWCLLVV